MTNKESVIKAIIFFSIKYEKELDFKVILEHYRALNLKETNANSALNKIVNQIVREMFLNEFNPLSCSVDEYKNYKVLYEYVNKR